MAHQYIFTMKDLRKVYPPNREVLKGIWLSFLPGAKIGVLGLNGAGKSTLLRIMAGVEEPSGGEARPAKGTRVGYLPQEPLLDASKDVLGNIEEGVAETRALLQRFNELNVRLGESLSEREMEKVLEEHGRVMAEIEAKNALELDRGQGIPWEGNYSSWLEQKRERLALEEKAETARQRTLQRELEWIRMSPRARQAKSKARVTAYEDLLRQETEKRQDLAEISIPAGPRLGNLVVEAKDLVKGYGDRVLIDGLSFQLPPGGIVGIIGPNGAGKTTLFRLIAGLEAADSGTVRTGDTVKLSVVDQTRDALRGEKNVWEEISNGEDEIELGSRTIPSRSYVAMFNFKGADQQKLVKNLSGGERNRVHLAKLLRSGVNLLLLDQPTNDLDVDTLRALEEGILNFAGSICVISHDRWFLDRISTHMIAFEEDGSVVWFEGNYQDYEANRHARLGAAADQPHRLKYKKLVRK